MAPLHDFVLKAGVAFIFCISFDAFLQTYIAPLDYPVATNLASADVEAVNNSPIPHRAPPTISSNLRRPPPTVDFARGSILGSTTSPDSAEGTLLSRAFQTLSHSLDPVAPLDGRTESRPTTPSAPNLASPPDGTVSVSTFSVSASSSLQTLSSRTSSVANSSWSWANYSRLPHALWPECSKLPNCLKFDYGVDGCEKWRQISSYPVVVGDMDGSGSRGIVWLLRAGGVWMRTTNEWLDWAKREHPLSNKIVEVTHTLDYQVKQLPLSVRKASEEATKATLSEFANVAQTQLGKWQGRKLKPWEEGLDAEGICPRRMGWKHGPTVFLQPVFNSATQQRFTFVHLIRDGRDMAFSRNRNNLAKHPKYGGQVVGLFKLGKSKNYNKCFFQPDEKHSAERDKECIVMQMRLWEKMNLGAAQYGQRELGPRYVPVRVEDLILPPDPNKRADAILLFFRRLGVNTVTTRAKALELSSRIFGSASLRSHFSIERWGGCNPKIIDEVEAAGREGLFHFGYATWRELEAQQRDEGGSPQGGNGCSVGSSQIQVPGTAGMQQGKSNKKGHR